MSALDSYVSGLQANTLTSIQVSNLLPSDLTSPFLAALSANTSLKTLNFSNSPSLGDGAIQSLINALASNIGISGLVLSLKNTGCSDVGGGSVAGFIRSANAGLINTIALDNNPLISDTSGSLIAQAVPFNTGPALVSTTANIARLSSITLSGCNIGNATLATFGSALMPTSVPSLVNLDFSNNPKVTDAGMSNFLVGLQANPTLQTLGLTGNGISSSVLSQANGFLSRNAACAIQPVSCPMIVKCNLNIDPTLGSLTALTQNNLLIVGGNEVIFAGPSNSGFNVTQVSNGYFCLVSNPGVPITTFTQAQVNTGNTIAFYNAGPYGQLPSFTIAGKRNGNYPTFIATVGTVNFTVAPTAATASSTSTTSTTQGPTQPATNATTIATQAVTNATQAVTNATTALTQAITNATAAPTSTTLTALTNATTALTQALTNATIALTQTIAANATVTTQPVTSTTAAQTQSLTNATAALTQALTNATTTLTQAATTLMTTSAASTSTMTSTTVAATQALTTASTTLTQAMTNATIALTQAQTTTNATSAATQALTTATTTAAQTLATTTTALAQVLTNATIATTAASASQPLTNATAATQALTNATVALTQAATTTVTPPQSAVAATNASVASSLSTPPAANNGTLGLNATRMPNITQAGNGSVVNASGINATNFSRGQNNSQIDTDAGTTGAPAVATASGLGASVIAAIGGGVAALIFLIIVALIWRYRAKNRPGQLDGKPPKPKLLALTDGSAADSESALSDREKRATAWEQQIRGGQEQEASAYLAPYSGVDENDHYAATYAACDPDGDDGRYLVPVVKRENDYDAALGHPAGPADYALATDRSVYGAQADYALATDRSIYASQGDTTYSIATDSQYAALPQLGKKAAKGKPVVCDVGQNNDEVYVGALPVGRTSNKAKSAPSLAPTYDVGAEAEELYSDTVINPMLGASVVYDNRVDQSGSAPTYDYGAEQTYGVVETVFPNGSAPLYTIAVSADATYAVIPASVKPKAANNQVKKLEAADIYDNLNELDIDDSGHSHSSGENNGYLDCSAAAEAEDSDEGKDSPSILASGKKDGWPEGGHKLPVGPDSLFGDKQRPSSMKGAAQGSSHRGGRSGSSLFAQERTATRRDNVTTTSPLGKGAQSVALILG